jgi:Co/Zn/Cd efflux system component
MLFFYFLRSLWLALPPNIKYEDVSRDLHQIPKVVRVHNLHIWCLTMEKVALSVHLATGNFLPYFHYLKHSNLTNV